MRMSTNEPFRRLELLLGEEAVKSIAKTRVIVFGVGGVGGWCAEALVRSGVGNITIVDDDVVAPSNINRQLPATMRTIGRKKVEVLGERFQEINPDLHIEAKCMRYTPETAAGFNLSGFDFVIDAIDSTQCKAHLIVAATSISSATLFSSMGAAGRIDVSRIKATPFAKVQGDGLARALRQKFKREGIYPAKNFTCVWSDEPAVNRGERIAEDGNSNGSFMPVTAAFGLRLASLVLSSAYGKSII